MIFPPLNQTYSLHRFQHQRDGGDSSFMRYIDPRRNKTRYEALNLVKAVMRARRLAIGMLHMDMTTILVIVVIVLLLGGGGLYGRGRWY